MKSFKNTVLLIVAVFLYTPIFPQTPLTPIDSFGTNPGNLKMYSYIPAGLSDTVSLVVALHGCTQTAATFAEQTGWNKLADRHKFLMLYPEQQSANNSAFCFNWFDSTYQIKDQIEVLSLKQMIDYMKSHYAFDTTRIYITGLSAGACMTTVMLANYPDLFHKGAIMAGVPFKASKDTSSAFAAMGGSVIKTPGEWSTLVKDANPGFTGSYPDVAIFHGSTDYVVNLKNADELIKQWTDLNNADQIADHIDTLFQGDTAISQIIYRDSINNNPVVYYYKIKGMGHGIAVDTGSCPRQGGATAAYSIKAHFHSTYWAADFFDLLKDPYSISGAVQVSTNATNIVYSVLSDSGSAYQWSVPLGASIVAGQGTNSITVSFGVNSGIVSTQEMTVDSCINDIASLYVSVLSYNVSISQTSTIVCHDSATAALSANVTGGNPPYRYSWSPTGGTTSVASGLIAGNYIVTVTDSTSVIISSNTYTITEPPAISTVQTFRVCAGESITVGATTHTTSGTFTDILPSYKNCDSAVTTHLTVLPANTTHQTFTKCAGEHVLVGSIIHNTTGTFTDVLTSFQGCDSTVTTDLIVTNAIDVSVNITSGIHIPILTANQAGANYQWINCNTANATILNATNQSYEAPESGSYALVITENNCSDTSFCYDVLASITNTVIPSGIIENYAGSDLNIYPNPFNLFTTLEFKEEQMNTLITITDMLGTEIKSMIFSGKQMTLESTEMSSGTYFIQIQEANRKPQYRKIMLQ